MAPLFLSPCSSLWRFCARPGTSFLQPAFAALSHATEPSFANKMLPDVVRTSKLLLYSLQLIRDLKTVLCLFLGPKCIFFLCFFLFFLCFFLFFLSFLSFLLSFFLVLSRMSLGQTILRDTLAVLPLHIKVMTQCLYQMDRVAVFSVLPIQVNRTWNQIRACSNKIIVACMLHVANQRTSPITYLCRQMLCMVSSGLSIQFSVSMYVSD